MEYFLQEDNAKFHLNKPPTEARERLRVERIDWPGYSLDANPIENVWGLIDSKLDKDSIENRADLEA